MASPYSFRGTEQEGVEIGGGESWWEEEQEAGCCPLLGQLGVLSTQSPFPFAVSALQFPSEELPSPIPRCLGSTIKAPPSHPTPLSLSKLWLSGPTRAFPVELELEWDDLASWVSQWERIRLPMQEMQVRSLGQEDPLEKEMATHCSILAWEIPQTEEPGRPQSTESLKRRTGQINWAWTHGMAWGRCTGCSLNQLPLVLANDQVPWSC